MRAAWMYSVSQNTPRRLHLYNLSRRCSILILFGRNVTYTYTQPKASLFSNWNHSIIASNFTKCWPIFKIFKSLARQFSSHSSGSLRFLNTIISQESVATRLRCGGIFNYPVTRNLLLSLFVKEF